MLCFSLRNHSTSGCRLQAPFYDREGLLKHIQSSAVQLFLIYCVRAVLHFILQPAGMLLEKHSARERKKNHQGQVPPPLSWDALIITDTHVPSLLCPSNLSAYSALPYFPLRLNSNQFSLFMWHQFRERKRRKKSHSHTFLHKQVQFIFNVFKMYN